MKILIIDNDISTVITLEASLKVEGGFEVTKAMGGKEGLEILKKKPDFDIVLLDIMMPDVSGMDVCQVMVNDDKLKELKVILMSALPIASKDFQESLEKFKELRVVKAVLEKPFAIEDLIKKIKEITK